jgi:hypothetical protein
LFGVANSKAKERALKGRICQGGGGVGWCGWVGLGGEGEADFPGRGMGGGRGDEEWLDVGSKGGVGWQFTIFRGGSCENGKFWLY